MPHPSRMPEMVMTPPFATALSRAEHEVTVVPLPLPLPVVPAAYPTKPLIAAAPQVFVDVVADPVDVEVVLEVLEVAFEVEEVVVAAAAENAQVHSLDMALGLLEQYDAHDGRLVVAVTVDCVKVLQNADAVALLAVMKDAHGSESGFVQASTAGRRAKIIRQCILTTFATIEKLI